MESQDNRKCINLLSFMVSSLKQSSKEEPLAYRTQDAQQESSEKWKRKRRYRTCFLYPCVTIITTKIHCLRVQGKMYLFQKESNTSNPIPPQVYSSVWNPLLQCFQYYHKADYQNYLNACVSSSLDYIENCNLNHSLPKHTANKRDAKNC